MWNTIKSIVLHQVFPFHRVNYADKQVECNTNQVIFYHNQVDSEHSLLVS